MIYEYLFIPEGLIDICAQSSQYQGKQYPCANVEMQDHLISLVQSGISDQESEAILQNNGVGSGRMYKLVRKDEQVLLKVVINEKGPKKGI